MSRKIIAAVCAGIICMILIFAACTRKNDGHTGLHVYVTDENGITVLDENGEPMTEEWITSVIYATDENGETYTNANGEKVTVFQTRPVYKEIVEESMFSLDENGRPVKGEDGSYVKVPMTRKLYRQVTDKDGNKITQAVTKKGGEKVTDKNGKQVTETVTESYTEKVTRIVEKVPDKVETRYITTDAPTERPTISKNDKADDKTTKATTTAAPQTNEEGSVIPTTTQKIGKVAASNLWVKGFGGSGRDKIVSVVRINSSSFAAVVETSSGNGDLEGISKSNAATAFVKFDQDGDVVWKKFIGSGLVMINDAAMLSDGSFILAGSTGSSSFGFEVPEGRTRSLLVKLSSEGDMVWSKTFSGTSPDYFTSVTATPDGGFAAGSKFRSPDGPEGDLGLKGIDGVVFKCDPSGNVQWTGAVTGSDTESIIDVASDSEGKIYVTGTSNSSDGDIGSSGGGLKVFAGAFSPSGQKLWVKTVAGSKQEDAGGIIALSNGCVICGSTSSYDGSFTYNAGLADGFICKFGSDGDVKWLKTYGNVKADKFNSIVKTSFGYAVAGSSASNQGEMSSLGKGGNDAFILSVSGDGTLEHVKGLGGSGDDAFNDICLLSGNDYIVCGETGSSDGALSGLSPKATASSPTAVLGKYSIY